MTNFVLPYTIEPGCIEKFGKIGGHIGRIYFKKIIEMACSDLQRREVLDEDGSVQLKFGFTFQNWSKGMW